MLHHLAATCCQGVNEPCQLDKLSEPLKPQPPRKSFANLATTIMPHASADETSSSAEVGTNECPSAHTYLGLLACNGQFGFLFAESSNLADDDSIIWCEFDALQALYFVPSQGKQAWTLGQNVNGPIAGWLSHLGSQFYGEL